MATIGIITLLIAITIYITGMIRDVNGKDYTGFIVLSIALFFVSFIFLII